MSYLWSTGASTAAISVSTGGTYTVTTTDANGCTSAPASQTVTVNPLPTATITPSGPTTFCAGGSVTLTASGGTSYLWSTGATTAAITVSASGTYIVTTTDANSCTSAPASQTVTVNPLPTATITTNGPTTFCAGGSVTLTASGGTSYLWSTGATTAAITASASGTYTVTTTDANGCTSAPASQTVTVNPLPTATITPSGPTTFCAGGSVTLTASGGTSYLWSTGATTAAITVPTSGTYSVTTTDANGCASAPASQTVTVNPLPTATITPNGPATFCTGGSVTLTASGGTSYLWSTGATTAAITVNTSGTYTVTTTDANGCTSAPASQTVTVNPISTVTITPNGPTTFCTGGSVTLTASGGTSYLWSTGATTNAITVSTGGTYTVTTTDANACTSAPASQTVTVTAGPAAVAGNSGPACLGSTIVLYASGAPGATYSWSGPGGFVSTEQTALIPNASAANAGTYTLMVSDGNCSTTVTTNVVVRAATPSPVASNGGPYCNTQRIVLAATTVPGAAYMWSGPNGFLSFEQNPVIANATPDMSGSYSVVAIVNGCSSAPAATSVVVNAGGCLPPIPVDIVINKTVDNKQPGEGDAVHFTITATNLGSGTASNIAVNDPLPAGLTLVSANPASGTYDTNSGVWSIPSLNEGATTSLTMTVTVNLGQSLQTIANCAHLGGSTPGDVNANDDGSCAAVFVQPPDLAVVKTVDNPLPHVGDVIHYTITVRNIGFGAASFTNVAVADVLPASVTLVAQSATQGSWDPVSGNWAVGTIAANGSATLTIAAQVNALVATVKIRNCATLTLSSPPDINPANNQSCAPVDLAVTETVDKPVAHEGDVIHYTVTVRNNGPSYADVVHVLSPAKPGVTVIGSTSSKGRYEGSTHTWDVGTLNVGESAVLIITATINGGTAGTTLTDCSNLSASTPTDDNSSNDQGCASVVVIAAPALFPDLDVTKSADRSHAYEGDTIAYAIQVTNHGTGGATNVIVTDVLPASLSLTAALPSAGTYNAATGAWLIPALADGQSAQLLLRATVKNGIAGSTVTNCAALSTPDINPANNSGCAAVIIDTRPTAECANHPPLLSVPLLQNIEVGTTLRFRVGAVDPDYDTVTLRAVGLPTNATFNAETGEFVFAPADGCDAEDDVYTPTFIAMDARGGVTTIPVSITVVRRDTLRHHIADPIASGARRQPLIAVPQLPVRSANSLLRFKVLAASQDVGCATELTLLSTELGSFDAATNEMTFNPTSGPARPVRMVRFRASDCRGRISTAAIPVDTAQGDVPLAVASVNQLTFSTTPAGSDRGSLIATLTNRGEGPVEVSAVRLKNGDSFRVEGADALPLTLRPAGVLELRVVFQPSHAGALDDQLSIVTNDGAEPVKTIALSGTATAPVTAIETLASASSASLTTPLPYDIRGAILNAGPQPNANDCANREPVISVPSLLTAEIGKLLRFRIAAADPDNDSIAVGITNLPPNANFNAATGEFTYTPAEECGIAADRIVDVTFVATDSRGASTSAPVQITIVAADSNSAKMPILAVPASALHATPGQALHFRVAVASPDLNCSPSVERVGPIGRFDAGSGEFGVTAPTALKRGSIVVPFRATDCAGNTVARSARIDVDDTPVRRLTAAVDAMQFGSAVSGTASNTTSGYAIIPLTNSGSLPLRVARVTLATGVHFRLDGVLGLPITLQPGQSLPVRVEFDPTTVGQLTDTLRVETDDADGAVLEIALRGESK
jgi:uncharacterized repeat protein (TIGR01451 family)